MGLNERLRQERERLGFSQQDFAAFVGASRKSQIRWEQGESSPDANALMTWCLHGADAQFILTGLRSPQDELASIQNSVKITIEKMPEHKEELLNALAEGIVSSAASVMTLTASEVELVLNFRGCQANKKTILLDTAKAFAGKI